MANPWQMLQQDILNAINAPTELLLGRPLVGNGTNGSPGSGKSGGAGGNTYFADRTVGQGGNGGLLLGVPGPNGQAGPLRLGRWRAGA